MNFRHLTLVSALAFAAVPLVAAAADSMVMMKSGLKWKDMGNGVMAAVVSGDMAKGASKFFLKYPAGLITPKHHHTPNHSGLIVSGNVTLTAEGKDYKLGPGDYMALNNQVSHVARVEGKDEVVFFIQADSPWDAVMEK